MENKEFDTSSCKQAGLKMWNKSKAKYPVCITCEVITKKDGICSNLNSCEDISKCYKKAMKSNILYEYSECVQCFDQSMPGFMKLLTGHKRKIKKAQEKLANKK